MKAEVRSQKSEGGRMESGRQPFIASRRTLFHACPVTGCGVPIKIQLAMCHSHWNLVPARIKKLVQLEYRRQPGSASHHAALRLAVAAVNETLKPALAQLEPSFGSGVVR